VPNEFLILNKRKIIINKIAVQLAPGFEEIEAITIVDVLRRADLNVVTISMTNESEVTGSHDIPVIADQLFTETEYSEFDVLILPGGMPGATNLDSHDGLKKQILDFNKNNKVLGAICAAPLVYGHLGILKGRKAVCYPGFEQELDGAFVTEEPAIIDGNIVTGRGVGTALKFSLLIVELLVGKDKSDSLAKAMLVE
jgi:4-methyl-5(b-hydroxyethyl)-thiazole monophosphate biosynthesis